MTIPHKTPLPDTLIVPDHRSDGSMMKQVAPGTPFRQIQRMMKSKDVCLDHSYGFAMSFYSWFKKQVSRGYPVNDYPSARKEREAWHDMQSALWMGVREGRPVMERAPQNPWLRDFYPDKAFFYIRFADFLGMNGARQWFEKGIGFEPIDFRLHPFYGVYFPMRQTHLQLFDEWLSDRPPGGRALDIGTGCGILAFILQKHGFAHIHATDINPNAIYSLELELARHGQPSGGQIIPECADLTGSFEAEAGDLLVCNPPWLPAPTRKMMDRATYYDVGFFDRLFSVFRSKSPPGCQIALLFSDFALQAGMSRHHPIKRALEAYRQDFILMEVHQRPLNERKVHQKSWLQSIRAKEQAELFIILRK